MNVGYILTVFMLVGVSEDTVGSAYPRSDDHILDLLGTTTSPKLDMVNSIS